MLKNGVSGPLTFVRTATKRAAGSKTSMKDSAGRRLGAKAGDGQLVRVGEIIYRQRGTNIYPGENMGIGRDHTLFAEEPGYVRYYYDPFHPKRKLVGIAMEKHARLPTPHFAPRPRRFGHDVIEDPEKAARELDVMKRKEFLAQPDIKKGVVERESKREAKKNELGTKLEQLGVEVNETDKQTVLNRLTEIQLCIIGGGRSVNEAREIVDDQYAEDAKIAKEFRNEPELFDKLDEYSSLMNKIDSMVTFSPEAELIKNHSKDELDRMASETIAKAEEIVKNTGKSLNDRRDEIKTLLAVPCFNLKLRNALLKKFHAQMCEPLQPVSMPISKMEQLVKEKKGKIIKKWNYQRERVEQYFVPFTPLEL